MSGRSMKMELDGNINIRQNIEEIFEKKIKRNQTLQYCHFICFIQITHRYWITRICAICGTQLTS